MSEISTPTPDDGNYRFSNHLVEEPEKPTRRAGAILSLLLAFIVGAVAGFVIAYVITKDSATMSQPAAVTNPTIAPTEPTQVEQVVQPPAKTPPMTPSDYYLSEERRAPLREAVDRIGRDWLSKLLSGEIPSTTRGWRKTAPAPYNGYGAIVSSNTRGPKPGETFIQVNVKFANGEVDTNFGPLGIFIIDKDGRMAGLDSETTLNGYEGTPILDTPQAFSWYLDLTEKLGSMHMAIVGGTIRASTLPDSALPLDRTQQYRIMLSDPEHPDDYREANIGDIMSADAQLLSFLNNREVTGSDW